MLQFAKKHKGIWSQKHTKAILNKNNQFQGQKPKRYGCLTSDSSSKGKHLLPSSTKTPPHRKRTHLPAAFPLPSCPRLSRAREDIRAPPTLQEAMGPIAVLQEPHAVVDAFPQSFFHVVCWWEKAPTKKWRCDCFGMERGGRESTYSQLTKARKPPAAAGELWGGFVHCFCMFQVARTARCAGRGGPVESTARISEASPSASSCQPEATSWRPVGGPRHGRSEVQPVGTKWIPGKPPSQIVLNLLY